MNDNIGRTDLSCLYRLGAKCESALTNLANEVAETTDPYVPFRTGWLKNCVRIEDNTSVRKRIVYYASYASECYYADHSFNPRRHPLATARWFEAAKAANLELWRTHAAENILG